VKSYGGARWSDPLTPWREADVRVEGVSLPELHELSAKIGAQGTRHALLDLYASSTDPILKRGGCLYGYFPDDPVDAEVEQYGDVNELRFRFEEAAV
jgi:hypothetical protein